MYRRKQSRPIPAQFALPLDYSLWARAVPFRNRAQGRRPFRASMRLGGVAAAHSAFGSVLAADIRTITDAAKFIRSMPTDYGGRLHWQLAGGHN